MAYDAIEKVTARSFSARPTDFILVYPFNGNFLFDFRTSTRSIDRTAFLGEVLADFVPQFSQ